MLPLLLRRVRPGSSAPDFVKDEFVTSGLVRTIPVLAPMGQARCE
jgi:hypothetical protein